MLVLIPVVYFFSTMEIFLLFLPVYYGRPCKDPPETLRVSRGIWYREAEGPPQLSLLSATQ